MTTAYEDGSAAWTRNEDGSFTPHLKRKQAQDTGPRALFWRGDYVGGRCYRVGDVVSDSGWLMTPNKPTCERPAPVPVGSPEWLYGQEAPPTEQVLAKRVTFGVQVTVPDTPFQVLRWRAYQQTDVTYSAYTVVDPEGEAVVEPLLSWVANADGWADFSLTSRLIRPGVTFGVVVQAHQPSGTPTQFTANWDYTTPNPEGSVPAAGQMAHPTQALGALRVHKTDWDPHALSALLDPKTHWDGGDRSTDLATVSPGDTIQGAGRGWAVLGTTDMGTYVQFDVAPAVQGTPGVGEFTFTVEEPTPLTIVRDVDYWLPSPGVVGLYSQDGSGLAVSQDAFGVDLYFQEMAFSGDWDVMVSP